MDFPVVIIPELFADQWTASERTYARLNFSLQTNPSKAFERNFVRRDARESRRVLHVGLTRAEEHLVLQGGHVDSGTEVGDVEIPFEFVDASLPRSVPWSPGGIDIPVWSDLQSNLPSDHSDWTDSVAASWSQDTGGVIRHNGTEYSEGEARELIHSLAADMVDGTLDVDRETTPIEVDRLPGRYEPEVSHRHSYTSMETFAECPRKHYLDHVVYAFDSIESRDETAGASQRKIGVVFHETAERAFETNATTEREWKQICEEIAASHGFASAETAAKSAIERYFDIEISDWEIQSVERQFTVTLDGHTVTGYIDAIYERPDGELVVIDYKATRRERTLEENRQLPLYLIACQQMLQRPVSTAGYAYVGEIGPKTELKSFSDDELKDSREAVSDLLGTIENAGFEEYNAGPHCQWCPHNHLPCAPESLQTE